MAARNVSPMKKCGECGNRAFPHFALPVLNALSGVQCRRDNQRKYAPMGVGCRIYRALHSADPVASAQAGCSHLNKTKMRRRVSAQDSRRHKHV